MKSFVDELKSKSIMNKEDIENFKKYIKQKYPSNSDKANAVILAKTVHQIIDNNLDGLEESSKEKIRVEVIKNTLLKERENILKYHIFEACLPLVDKKEDFKSQLTQWINSNQSSVISENVLEQYIVDINKAKTDKENEYIEINNICIDTKEEKEDHIDKSQYDENIDHEEICCTVHLTCEHSSIKNNNIYAETKIQIKYFISFINSITKVINVLRELINLIKNNINYKLQKYALAICGVLVLVYIISLQNSFATKEYSNEAVINYNEIRTKKEISTKQETSTSIIEININENIEYDELAYHPHLPQYFNYIEINSDKLIKYLHNRNSLLAEEPYFSTIIYTSKEFNLNPLILFAITGQEQGFVPKHHENSNKIANNPYNVFHSWQEYNTDIKDSSRIAARTVINLALGLPEKEDAFKWINRQYAEDKNWWKGVKAIYTELAEICIK